MKIKSSVIKHARYVSKSPLVVSIIYDDGCSAQENYWTLWTAYTHNAYDKIMALCDEHEKIGNSATWE